MFNPRKIGSSAGSAAQYYAKEFHREDYYTKGEELPGTWHGGKSLGLDGTQVSHTQLLNVFQGKDLSGNPLVQGAGELHTPGWDMPFSAPKSVSVLWGISDENTRSKIQTAHERAVDASLEFIKQQSLSSSVRRGKGGKEREAPADVIFAKFQHGTSRMQDPQLHTHVLLVNMIKRHDGTWGSLQPDGIYREQKLIGALYRAELAALLQKDLGLSIERDKDSFRLSCVPTNVEETFSKRRQQIERELERRGADDARTAAHVARITRDKKAEMDRSSLYSAWKEEAKSFGFDETKSRENNRTGPEKKFLTQDEIIKIALSELTKEVSTFIETKLFQKIAEHSQGHQSFKDCLETFQRARESKDLVPLEAQRFTTQDIQRLEQEMVNIARFGRESLAHRIEPSRVNQTLEERSLAPEQKAAILHVTSGGLVSALEGWAGSGKSYTMDAAREVFEREGYRVQGIAPTGKAADNLQDGSKIPSKTIDKFLYDLQRQPETLNSKTVLVLDEAGMVGSHKMNQILKAAKESHTKVIIIGDAKQLQPLDAGGAFRELQKELGCAQLKDIRRQKQEWQREAVKDFAEGRAAEGLAKYNQAGLLHIGDTAQEMKEKLIQDWKQDLSQSKLIIASSNAQVKDFNEMARDALKSEKKLKGMDKVFEIKTKSGEKEERRFCKGDRIVFIRNSKEFGVKNGQFGTIEKINDRSQKSGAEFRVKMDNGKDVRFHIGKYNFLEHGYAATIYKSQGSTIDKVYVAHNGVLDREGAYVAMSRHKEDVRIYVNKENFPAIPWDKIKDVVKKDERKNIEKEHVLQEMSRNLATSHQKDTSQDYKVKQNEHIKAEIYITPDVAAALKKMEKMLSSYNPHEKDPDKLYLQTKNQIQMRVENLAHIVSAHRGVDSPYRSEPKDLAPYQQKALMMLKGRDIKDVSFKELIAEIQGYKVGVESIQTFETKEKWENFAREVGFEKRQALSSLYERSIEYVTKDAHLVARDLLKNATQMALHERAKLVYFLTTEARASSLEEKIYKDIPPSWVKRGEEMLNEYKLSPKECQDLADSVLMRPVGNEPDLSPNTKDDVQQKRQDFVENIEKYESKYLENKSINENAPLPDSMRKLKSLAAVVFPSEGRKQAYGFLRGITE